MQLIELSKNEFNNYRNKMKNINFFQSLEMANFLEQSSKKVYYLAFMEKNEIIGLALLNENGKKFGKTNFQCLKGPLIDNYDKKVIKELLNLLIQFVKNKNGYRVSIDPYILVEQRDIDGKIVVNGTNNKDVINLLENIGFKKSKIDYQVKTIFCLDVKNKSSEELYKDFNSTTKNSINKAQKMGVEIVDLTKEELGRFKILTKKASEKHAFKDKEITYYEKMYDCFKDKVVYKIAVLDVKKYIKVLQAEKQSYKDKIGKLGNNVKKKQNYELEISYIDKKLNKASAYENDFIDVSGAMFILDRDETIYLFSGSDDKYNEFCGQYLLQWDIIQYACSHNCNRHNFFGIFSYDDPNGKEFGIYSFKRGFNGYVEELFGEYEYYMEDIKSQAIKLLKRFKS